MSQPIKHWCWAIAEGYIPGWSRSTPTWCSVGLSDGTAKGCHLMEARVRPTLEVILVESPKHLQRKWNEEVGLALIDVEG